MRWIAFCFAALIPALAQGAETLYAASVRTRISPDGVTGLAEHPR